MSGVQYLKVKKGKKSVSPASLVALGFAFGGILTASTAQHGAEFGHGFGTYFVICYFVCLVLYAFKALIDYRKALKAASPFPQVPRVAIPKQDVGFKKTAPIFHGLRVIEIATHVAAPSAGRVLSDLGAEVIKVEKPQGDAFRRTFLEYEDMRKSGSAFAIYNFNKFGITLDYTNEDDLETLEYLLEGADIVLTSMLTPLLKEHNLDYEYLSQRFPHLVYARVCAWGTEGDESSNPGFDIGGFWGATGVASTMVSAPNMSQYPPAIGDMTTGQALVGGIATALRARMKTGYGSLVDCSLMHSGCWVVASQATGFTDSPPRPPAPSLPREEGNTDGEIDEEEKGAVQTVNENKRVTGNNMNDESALFLTKESSILTRRTADPFCSGYHSSDEKPFVLLFSSAPSKAKVQCRSLLKALGFENADNMFKLLSVVEKGKMVADQENKSEGMEETTSESSRSLNAARKLEKRLLEEIAELERRNKKMKDLLRKKFATLSMSEISSLLDGNHLPFRLVADWEDVLQPSAKDWTYIDAAKVFDKPPPGETLERVLRIPYSFSCCPENAVPNHAKEEASNETSKRAKNPQLPSRHGVYKCAPLKGENNYQIFRLGWSPRSPTSRLPKSNNLEDLPERVALFQPLRGIRVVEINAHPGTAIAGCGALLSSMGAEVVSLQSRVVQESLNITSSTKVGARPFYTHLHRGKKAAVNLDHASMKFYLNEWGEEGTGADIVLTDSLEWTEQAWKREDLSYKLKKIVCYLSNFSSNFEDGGTVKDMNALVEENHEPILGAFMAMTDNCAITNGHGMNTPNHILEQLASIYMFSAATIALFHRDRTGEGNFVDIPLLRIGYWTGAITSTWMWQDPGKIAFVRAPKETNHDDTPLFTYNSFACSDGQWIQLMGIDVGRHMGKTLAALDISLGFDIVPAALRIYFNEVRQSKEKNKLAKLRPIFRHINSLMRKKILQKPFSYWDKRLKNYKVWFTKMRMPRETRTWNQARVNGVWERALLNNQYMEVVTSPIRVVMCGGASTHNPIGPKDAPTCTAFNGNDYEGNPPNLLSPTHKSSRSEPKTPSANVVKAEQAIATSPWLLDWLGLTPSPAGKKEHAD